MPRCSVTIGYPSGERSTRAIAAPHPEGAFFTRRTAKKEIILLYYIIISYVKRFACYVLNCLTVSR